MLGRGRGNIPPEGMPIVSFDCRKTDSQNAFRHFVFKLNRQPISPKTGQVQFNTRFDLWPRGLRAMRSGTRYFCFWLQWHTRGQRGPVWCATSATSPESCGKKHATSRLQRHRIFTSEVRAQKKGGSKKAKTSSLAELTDAKGLGLWLD